MFRGSYSISEQTSYYKKLTTKNGFKKKISLKHVVREMYGRGNVLVGKCPSGEMSSQGSVGWKSVSRGIVPREVSFGELSPGKYHSGNCPVGELSAYRGCKISDKNI